MQFKRDFGIIFSSYTTFLLTFLLICENPRIFQWKIRVMERCRFAEAVCVDHPNQSSQDCQTASVVTEISQNLPYKYSLRNIFPKLVYEKQIIYNDGLDFKLPVLKHTFFMFWFTIWINTWSIETWLTNQLIIWYI